MLFLLQWIYKMPNSSANDPMAIYQNFRIFSTNYERIIRESSSSTIVEKKARQYQLEKINNALKFLFISFSEDVKLQNNHDFISELKSMEPIAQTNAIKGFIVQFAQDEANIAAFSQEAKRLFYRDFGFSVFAGLLLGGGVFGGLAFGILCSSPPGALLIVMAGLLLSALTLHSFSVGRSLDKSQAITENILNPIRFFKETHYNGEEISRLESVLEKVSTHPTV